MLPSPRLTNSVGEGMGHQDESEGGEGERNWAAYGIVALPSFAWTLMYQLSPSGEKAWGPYGLG